MEGDKDFDFDVILLRANLLARPRGNPSEFDLDLLRELELVELVVVARRTLASRELERKLEDPFRVDLCRLEESAELASRVLLDEEVEVETETGKRKEEDESKKRRVFAISEARGRHGSSVCCCFQTRAHREPRSSAWRGDQLENNENFREEVREEFVEGENHRGRRLPARSRESCSV